MNLINRDDIEIDISDSVIFSRLIDFKEGRTTYDDTVNLIIKDVEECVKESINKLPVLTADVKLPTVISTMRYGENVKVRTLKAVIMVSE